MAKTTANAKKLRRQARAKAFEALPAARAPGRMPVRFSVMAKPIGPACNLRCKYCFYLEKDALFAAGDRRMSEQVLEAYVRKYIASEPSREVTFHWQGGEPTLMGLDFYRQVMALQQRYAAGKRISNTLQTNGTLLDNAWGAMLAQNHWLVGISLDGPEEIHNANRPDASGGGSYAAVRRGLEVLKAHRVEFNVLASVTPISSADPLRVYRFFREIGVNFVQFMPIVERMPDDEARQLGLQLAVGVRAGQEVFRPEMTPWSVKPEAYGEFLCRIFDEWVRHDVGTFFVMNFEWALAAFLGLPPRVCQFMPVCGRSLILEHNGDVFACDHYVYPAYRLGNIVTDDLQDMVQSPAQVAFGQGKQDNLPKYCRECPLLPACRGECPKRRFLTTPDGEPGLNYLCPAYKRFYAHAAPYFEAMRRLQNNGQPLADIMQTDLIVMSRKGLGGKSV